MNASLSQYWWEWMFAASISGIGLAVLFLLLEQCFSKRIWPSVFYCLWLVFFIRMALPPLIGNEQISLPDRLNHIVLNGFAPSTYPNLLTTGWLLGFLLLSALVVYRQLSYHRAVMRLSEPLDDTEYCQLLASTAKQCGVKKPRRCVVHPNLTSPMLLGMLHPVLVLPASAEFSRQEQQLMMAHEFCHLRRKDHWLQGFSLMICLLFWFNPLIWVARQRLTHWLEVSCDAKVIRTFPNKEKGYRRLLLNQLALQQGLSTTPGLALTGSSVLARYGSLDHRHHTGKWVLAALLAVALILPTLIKPSLDSAVWLSQQNPEQLQGSVMKRYAVMARLNQQTSESTNTTQLSR